MIFGFMGFWTQDVWAPQFLSFVIMEFLAGSIFPLDILPKALFLISKSLPFYYFMYFPLGVYLGKIAGWDLVTGFAGVFLWIGIFVLAVRLMWRRGLRVYTAEGR
jgi:ABC-2 type transport system permease protein